MGTPTSQETAYNNCITNTKRVKSMITIISCLKQAIELFVFYDSHMYVKVQNYLEPTKLFPQNYHRCTKCDHNHRTKMNIFHCPIFLPEKQATLMFISNVFLYVMMNMYNYIPVLTNIVMFLGNQEHFWSSLSVTLSSKLI